MKAISMHARKRQAKDYGYGDKGEKWTALPEPVRELVKGINDAPPHARGAVVERIRDNLQRNPEWVKEMTLQLERERSRNRGRGR